MRWAYLALLWPSLPVSQRAHTEPARRSWQSVCRKRPRPKATSSIIQKRVLDLDPVASHAVTGLHGCPPASHSIATAKAWSLVTPRASAWRQPCQNSLIIGKGNLDNFCPFSYWQDADHPTGLKPMEHTHVTALPDCQQRRSLFDRWHAIIQCHFDPMVRGHYKWVVTAFHLKLN